MFGGRQWDGRALDRLNEKLERAKNEDPRGLTDNIEGDIQRTTLWSYQELVIISSHLWYANEQLRKLRQDVGWILTIIVLGIIFHFIGDLLSMGTSALSGR